MMKNVVKKNQKIPFLFMLMLLACMSASAQFQVKGTVVSANDSEPMIGVTILENGTHNGCITDLNGNYSISVESSNATLEVSFIGYKSQTVKVSGRNVINFRLEEDTEVLDEVVVVGYGVQRKSDLTGSVASVKADELKGLSTTDAAAALQGKASGVQILNGSGKPGQGASIRVRGYSSNSNNIGPLLIVDGLQVSSIQYLDPSMIESMEVLKDAASAAIYGAEAGNGVVLITTKSGKKGRSSITYSGKWTNQSLGDVPSLLNATQFKDWMTMQLGAESVNAALADAQTQYGWDPNTNTDWLKAYFEDTWAQQHTLTLEGGNDRGSYFLSVNHVNQDGIVKGSKDKYERLTAQINADYMIKDWLKVGTNTSIEKWSTRGISEQGYGSSFEMLLLIDPLTPLYWTKPEQMLGEYRDYYNKIQAGDSNYTLFGDENGYYATSYFNQRLAGGNPFSQRDRSESRNSGVNVNGTAYMNVTPVKQVTFTSRLGYRISFNNESDYQYPYYLNGQTKGDNYIISGASRNSTWYQWENFANYNDTFAGKHAVGAMAGMSYRQSDSNFVSANASGLDILKAYSSNFIYLDCVNANEGTTKNIGGIKGTTRALSYFGRVTYSYDNRYSVQANFRADASSRFAPGNRWGCFPSFSGAWRISEESFMETLRDSWLSSLKIRGSWGQLGNQDALGNGTPTGGDYYPWMNTYNLGANYPFGGSLVTGYYQGSYKMASLSWEKATTWGIGIDFTLFNKLTGSIDYYNRKTTDIIMNVSVPKEFALGAYKDNVGAMKNSGIEVQLAYNDTWNDWTFGVSGNFAYNKNTIENLGGVDRMADGSFMREVGSPINSWFVYRTDGFFQSDEEAAAWQAKYSAMDGYPFGQDFKAGDLRYVDANGDGKISADDRELYRTKDPKFTFGFNINVGYKNVDLSMNFNGAAGVGYAFTKEAFGEFSGSAGHPSTAWLDSWTPENKNASMPRIAEARVSPSEASNVLSDFWIMDTSYLRMKTIQLGYTLPKNWIEKWGIQNLRVYYSAENLLTFDDMPINVDPETVSERLSSYPLNKTHSFGVNITF